MARPTASRRTRRARVQSTEQNNVTGVYAPSYAQGDSEFGRAAQELGQALDNSLGAITELDKQLIQRDQRKAAADVATGDTKEDGSEAYLNMVSVLQTEADFALMKDDMASALDKNQWLDMEEAEVDEFIDNEFRSRWDAIAEDSPHAAKVLAPKMLEYRMGLLTQHKQEQLKRERETRDADLQISLRDEYKTSGTIDYETLGERVRLLRADGKERRELFAGVIFDLAIQNGDPELLDNAPKQFPNGAPTIFALPEWNGAVAKARNAAEQERKRRQTQLENDINAAQAEELRQQGLTVAAALVNGQNPWPAIQEYAEMPGAKGSEVLAFESAWQRIRDDREERDADFTDIAIMETSIMAGEVEFVDIFSAYADGTLGSGQAARQELSRLLGVWRGRERDLNSDQRVRHSAYERQIRETFNPNPGMGMPRNQTLAQIQLEAMREFQMRVTQATGDVNPQEITDEIILKYQSSLERRKEMRRGGEGLEPLRAIHGLSRGEVPPAEFLMYNIPISQINTFHQNGEITDDQALMVLQTIEDSIYPIAPNLKE